MKRPVMSDARRNDERIWLRARLRDLRIDIKRFADTASEVALGGVETHLGEAQADVERAISVLDKVPGSPSHTGSSSNGAG